jgi:AcrR family transcriptional regulator
MSDLIRLTELLKAADEESAEVPALPEPAQRRALREAAGVPMTQIAAAVGVSGPTIYRAEAGTHRMRSAAAERRYRRVLTEIHRLLVECDPAAIGVRLAA